MQAIFINSVEITTPPFFTRYVDATGQTMYQRIESSIDSGSFQGREEAVRVELYDNRAMPVLVGVVHRQ